MKAKHLRMIGNGLLGGGAALAFGSINNLYQMAEKAEGYRDILAPHVGNFSTPGISTGISDSAQWGPVRLSSSEASELRLLHALSIGGPDIGIARAVAFGSVIMIVIGISMVAKNGDTAPKNGEGNQSAP